MKKILTHLEGIIISTKILTRDEPNFQGKKVRLVREGMEPIIAMYSGAWSMANAEGLDLVLVAEDAEPPVVKIMDYSKELYRRKKQEKKMSSQQTKTKEIKFGLQIDPHDYGIKINQAKKFLEKKMRVKLTVVIKGWRDAQNKTGIEALLNNAIENLSDKGTPESEIKHSAKMANVVLIHK